MFPLTSGVGKNMTIVNYEQLNISSVTGTGGFTAGGSICNVGIAANFPWLGSVSGNFAKFRFKFLRFIYVPRCPSTTPGSVYLYFSYDPKDIAPASLAQVAASESSVIGNSWYGGPINPDSAFSKGLTLRDNIYLDVDCTRFTQPWYYVRANDNATSNTVTLIGTATGGNGTLAINSGATYEYTARPGTIYYGSDGVTNGVVAGTIYMSYAVELYEPIAAAVNA
uniref:Capsid protein n=1 Tax=Riboviria sp. TaxID=2585031 RepID=A0A514D0G8_9VIRU|nr:MAG: hypothetical protein H4Rhizo433487_000002 [Riboviria sp.]